MVRYGVESYCTVCCGMDLPRSSRCRFTCDKCHHESHHERHKYFHHERHHDCHNESHHDCHRVDHHGCHHDTILMNFTCRGSRRTRTPAGLLHPCITIAVHNKKTTVETQNNGKLQNRYKGKQVTKTRGEKVHVFRISSALLTYH